MAYENSKFSPSFIEALDHNRDVNVLNNDILESKILFCIYVTDTFVHVLCRLPCGGGLMITMTPAKDVHADCPTVPL